MGPSRPRGRSSTSAAASFVAADDAADLLRGAAAGESEERDDEAGAWYERDAGRRARAWDGGRAAAEARAVVPRRLPVKTDEGAVVQTQPAAPKPVLREKPRAAVPEHGDEDGDEDEAEYSDASDADDDDDRKRARLDGASRNQDHTPHDDDGDSTASGEKETNASLASILALPYADLRLRVATLATAVLENPTDAVKPRSASEPEKRGHQVPHGEATLPSELGELQALAKHHDARIATLATASLAAVYRDILPSYFVRQLTDKEKAVRVKKDLKATRDFEESLVAHYAIFVDHLGRLLRSAPWEARERIESDAQKEDAAARARSALVGACSLLLSRPDFNLADTLLLYVTQRVSSPDAATATKCCDTLAQLMQDDKSFAKALLVVRHVAKRFEHRGSISPGAIRMFSRLELDADLKDLRRIAEAEEFKRQRKRRRRKMGAEVAKLLEEREAAQSDRHQAFSRQQELLRELFTLYLRVLTDEKDPPASGPSFATARQRREAVLLETLRSATRMLKLVNPEIVHGFVRVLSEVNGLRPDVELSLVQAGMAACKESKDTIDDAIFLKRLLAQIDRLDSDVGVVAATRCVEIAFVRGAARDSRLAAQFCASLSAAALRIPTPGASLALLAVQRLVFAKYPNAREVCLSKEAAGHEVGGLPIPVAGSVGDAGKSATTRVAWEMSTLASGHVFKGVREFARASLGGLDTLRPGEAPRELFEVMDFLDGEVMAGVPTRHGHFAMVRGAGAITPTSVFGMREKGVRVLRERKEGGRDWRKSGRGASASGGRGGGRGGRGGGRGGRGGGRGGRGGGRAPHRGR